MYSEISKRNNGGFSLIELIVVIAIIGILVMLAAPRFLGYTEKARVARITNDVKVVEGKVAEEYVNADYQFDTWGDEVNLRTEADGKSIYSVQSTVKKNDSDLLEGDYEIVKKPLIYDARTKLDGTFYAHTSGKVYYIDDKTSKDTGAEEPGDGGGETKVLVATILPRSESGFYSNSLKDAAIKLGVPNSSSYDNFDIQLLEAYRRGVSWWEEDYENNELMLAKIDNKFLLIQVEKEQNTEQEKELYEGADYRYSYDEWNVMEITDAKMVSDKNINWNTFDWDSVAWEPHLISQKNSAPQHAKIVYVVGYHNHFERVNTIGIPLIPAAAWSDFITEYKLIENDTDMFPIANSY